MLVCILYSVSLYCIHEVREDKVSFKPKAWDSKPHGGKYGE